MHVLCKYYVVDEKKLLFLTNKFQFLVQMNNKLKISKESIKKSSVITIGLFLIASIVIGRSIFSGSITLEEQEDGFTYLFDGTNLDQWTGNKTDYFIKNKKLVVRPGKGGHGNLFTVKEYSDFIFRFEFKLTPGANNGLGIHASLKGDAAYEGKEIQILDNTADKYKDLKPYQYHGSIYGIIPAKRGYLKPVGEWNYQEVYVKGDDIKVTLNGTIILDGNIKEASKNGTMDHKKHPGLKRHKGHIGFLGHGDELEFKNIRIKDLSK